MRRRIQTREQAMGILIKEMREDAGLTQDVLGRRLGFDGQTAISRMENGIRPMRLDEFPRFCKATDYDPFEVLKEVMRISEEYPGKKELNTSSTRKSP